MASEQTCAGGGYLVGPAYHVPDDPSERAWPGAKTLVGCNRLRCSACRQPVVQRPGFDALPPLRDRVAEVHAAPSWQPWVDAGALEIDPRVRLYLCACTFHREMAASPVVDDPEGRPGGPATWCCAGHPPVVARGAGDAAGFVAAALGGAAGGPQAIDRRYNLTDDPAERTALADAVLAAVTADDPVHRMRALGFFLRNPRVPQAAQVVDRYRARPELFDGVPDPLGGRPSVAVFLLEVVAARTAVADRFPDADAARDVVRAALLAGGPVPDRALSALASVDADWLAGHAAAVVAAVPAADATERAGAVVYALRYLPDDELIAAAVDVAEVAGVDRDELTEFLVDAIGGRPAELLQRALAP